MTYKTVETQNPPIIREIDGKTYIEVTEGELTIRTRVGSWFILRVMEIYVIPRLKKDDQR